ncbi:PP0621 family protein [Alcanivorax hongdengensis]|uniref:PP0621 family protein n=1 Tax=Alcanivorax hongdengensis TaxID=519051 RepID=UPI0002FA987A|nr:PP0621 family protein [Alcanivorax hongdengensis]
MGLIRLLIIAVLLYLAWRVVKNLLQTPSPGSQSGPDKDADPERMLKCQQCGVHVPAHEAFSHGQLHFCSQEHQRRYLEHHGD